MFFFTERGEMTDIAIIGGGPAGVMCALCAAENKSNNIYIFDKNIILKTILPTGGGRCNLAYAEYNFKELTKFYPRGEKFLYSIFSRFSTKDTLNFFEKIGVKTYTQKDNRIFPVSDSSKEVKDALIKETDKNKNIKKIFENVIELKKEKDKFKIKTNKNLYTFDKVVISTGGKGNGQELAKKLGHNIVDLKPALCSLKTKENNYYSLAGVSVKNITATVFFNNKKQKKLSGDLLFTHFGISGPVVYKISSYFAYSNFDEKNPLKISFNLVNKNFEEFDENFSKTLKNNAQKDIVNVLSDFIPKNLAYCILEKENIKKDIKSGQLTKKNRQKISKTLTEFVLNAQKTTAGEEIVTAGGVDLKEIDSKTMESKLIKNLFFCGEVIDIDGLTGGFNLQNCWSCGFVAGNSLT